MGNYNSHGFSLKSLLDMTHQIITISKEENYVYMVGLEKQQNVAFWLWPTCEICHPLL